MEVLAYDAVGCAEDHLALVAFEGEGFVELSAGLARGLAGVDDRLELRLVQDGVALVVGRRLLVEQAPQGRLAADDARVDVLAEGVDDLAVVGFEVDQGVVQDRRVAVFVDRQELAVVELNGAVEPAQVAGRDVPVVVAVQEALKRLLVAVVVKPRQSGSGIIGSFVRPMRWQVPSDLRITH